jgi:hypothetical protein
MSEKRRARRLHERSRPRIDPAILYRELRSGCLLYHPVTNEAHALNLTAAYIWSGCDGQRDVAGLAAHLAETCRLSFEDALNDVRLVLNEFHAKKLLL